jgi:membrane-associated protease RseP (regulator of RpoE activity)
MICTAVASIVLALPAQLLARATMYWYQPHYMPSVDDASNRLQFSSPHFAPLVGNVDLTTGYSLQRVDVNKLGINLSFTKSGVNQSSQYYWSWWGGYVAPVTTPFKDDIVTTIVYADVSYFEIYNNAQAVDFPSTWCVDYVNRGPQTTRNSTICVAAQADSYGLIDALATLVVASGGSLDISPGVQIRPSSDKEFRNHPARAGLQITRLEVGGPPLLAGIKEGDIIHSINGKLCTGESVFFEVFNKAIREKPDGGLVHLEVLRKNNSMAFDLHYPNPDENVAQLRQQSAAPSTRHPVGSVIQIPSDAGAPAAPLSPVRFGFQVRAVTDADVVPMGLAKARGIVVVDVEKGSLAEKMGFLIGDVILEVNNSEIGDQELFAQYVHSGAAKKFKVWRKGQSLDLVVPESM